MAPHAETHAGPTLLQRIARIVAAVGLVAGITFVFFRMVPVNATTAGFAYLIGVLVIGATWGLAESVTGSLLAVLFFNFFFLPPIGTFTIADPQNWVALFAFLVTSITASRLSAQARTRAREAQERQEEMERLYALSRSILLTDPGQAISKQLAGLVARTFGARAVALFDRAAGEIYRGGPEDFPGLDEQLRMAVLAGTQFASATSVITAVRLGSEPIGSLGMTGVQLSDSALQGVANLVAIGLEKARAQEAATRAEAARQSDELKSVLLDAIAHEFKTPLTTIKVSTTALLSGRLESAEQQRNYISLVDEETDRLNGLVSDAIQMARLEAGHVQLHLASIDLAEITRRMLDRMHPAWEDHPVEIAFPAEMPKVPVDPTLIELTLRQLISNAVKYGSPRAPIHISGALEDGRVAISVQDHGQGISETDLPRIFDRFYRGRGFHNHVPGAGLGLFIAREIVRAHGGEIWAESKAGVGSVFHFSLPLAQKEETR
ncbi:MAG TPA: ATP-binding protein [Bryobacteraceae bacterium]|nr:ATP-binding protein [Bryobacteraceae bacterium]